ncbi:hypothetical protein Ciccas_008944 [Cichlidogyrus casuarinus]|uniref:Tc1-like transposase DDE domain-containing protein n=1 Tax=Cichlidogyrus casuarinus TaxID=1844966 RepID=A0ABD2PYG4_9PLAT
MDNAPIHRKTDNFRGVRMEHELRHFDAPYSPQLNPCEGVFSVMKARVRSYLEQACRPENDRNEAGDRSLIQFRTELLIRGLEVSLSALTRSKI